MFDLKAVKECKNHLEESISCNEHDSNNGSKDNNNQ